MPTRPAPGTQRPHRLSRLAALLSLRTISGKLIIGLVVLLGAASIIVSVVTSSSLNKSLMSSVDQQLQSATMRWQNCVNFSPDGDTDLHHGTGQGPLPACYGQAAGTFEAELTGNTFSNLNLVPGRCELSAADEQTLLALHTTQVPGARPGAPARPGGPGMPSYTRTLASLDGDYRLTKIQISPSEILVTGLPLATVQGTLNDVANFCVRGQYRTYRDEQGVAPDSQTPTYAAMRFMIDSWRWQGVPFYLRAGKKLAEEG